MPVTKMVLRFAGEELSTLLTWRDILLIPQIQGVSQPLPALA